MKNFKEYIKEVFDKQTYKVFWPIKNIIELHDWFLSQIPFKKINLIHITILGRWRVNNYGYISVDRNYIKKFLQNTDFKDFYELRVKMFFIKENNIEIKTYYLDDNDVQKDYSSDIVKTEDEFKNILSKIIPDFGTK